MMNEESVFAALASTPRRKILAYLSETPLTAGEIAERFEMTKPSMSKHLQVLEHAGLVKSEKRGQFVHYSLAENNLPGRLYDFVAGFCPVAGPLKKESAALAAGRKRKPATSR
jgi:ArsR family transcriptional regulator, arsenate/arsenite/antimonite-responsive transcriptional repressor